MVRVIAYEVQCPSSFGIKDRPRWCEGAAVAVACQLQVVYISLSIERVGCQRGKQADAVVCFERCCGNFCESLSTDSARERDGDVAGLHVKCIVFITTG